MGKFKAAMSAAKTAKDQTSPQEDSTELQNDGNTEIQQAVNTELSEDKVVSLTIKVPESLRTHWQVKAKERKTSVTQLIVDYLKQELGEPDPN